MHEHGHELNHRAAMNTEQLENDLAAILGHPVLVVTECGLAIYNRDTVEELYSASKMPATVTAAQIMGKMAKKAADATAARARREAAIQAIKSTFAAAGFKSSAVYYQTSFGFSVCNLFADGIEKAKALIEGAGIAFKRLEYSPAHWVVRVYL